MMKTNVFSPDLFKRDATRAVVLMVGFYVLAIVVAGLLVSIPYLEWLVRKDVTFRVALSCLAGAAVILYSVFPRVARFNPPGPELKPEEHQMFFRMLQEVAEATNQEMPVRVYMLFEMNAWVAERRSIPGRFRKRIMGIGLPLLQTVNTSQLRAIIAHEFGHYGAGDTRLAPWLYRTRTAIGRTLRNLESRNPFVQKPFVWYGNMFLKITQEASRYQELRADALAARVAGRQAMIEGLKLTTGMGAAFNYYMADKVYPVLERGFLPPVAEGFTRFLGSSEVTKWIDEATEAILKQEKPDIYDTHPPLTHRIAALENAQEGLVAEEKRPAILLLGPVSELENTFFRTLQVKQKPPLEPISWDEVGTRVWVPHCDQVVGAFTDLLAPISFFTLTEIAKNPEELSSRIEKLTKQESPEEDRIKAAVSLLAIAVTAALSKNGWHVQFLPESGVTAERGGKVIEPFKMVRMIVVGETTTESWQKQCLALGIANLTLAVRNKQTL